MPCATGDGRTGSVRLEAKTRLRPRFSPRVKPRLFNVLAALSLLLCVATVVLWVRSYSGSDYVDGSNWERDDAFAYTATWGAWSAEGRLCAHWNRSTDATAAANVRDSYLPAA